MKRFVLVAFGLAAIGAYGQVAIGTPERLNAWASSDQATDGVPNGAANQNGDLVFIWTTDQNVDGQWGEDLDIAVIRSNDYGASWSQAAPLNSHALTDTPGLMTGEADKNADIATDGKGTWVAVWSYGSPDGLIDIPLSGADFDIYFSVSKTNGRIWTAAAPLGDKATTDRTGSDPPPQQDDFPKIATNGQGTWICAWVDTFGTVFVSRSIDNTFAWDEGQTVSSIGGNFKFDPVIASDGKRTWICAWADTPSVSGEILYSVSTNDGVDWSAPGEIGFPGPPDQARNPDVIFNPSADRWFATYSSTADILGAGVDGDVWFVGSPDGLAWSGHTLLLDQSTSDTWNETQPSFATDNNDNWAVVMIRETTSKGSQSPGTDVAVAISKDNGLNYGGPFSIGNLPNGETGTDSIPTVVGTGSERWVAAWQATDGDLGNDTDVLRTSFGFTGSIVGRVVSLSGEPFGCATIVATNLNDNSRRVATNNASGYFRIEGLPAGDYSVAVITSSTLVAMEEFEIDTGERQIVRFEIDPREFPGSLFGRVRQRNTDTFIVDALVEVFQNNVLIASTRTCATGQYAFFDLFGKLKGTENVDVMYSQEGFDDETQNVNVDPENGTEADQDMELKGAPVVGTLTGFITDADTLSGIDGATVTLQGGIFVATFADSDGAFVFESLLASPYDAEASAMDYDSIDVGTNINASPGVTFLDFELTPGNGSPAGPEDVNGDTFINAVDIQLVINGVLGLPIAPAIADVNGDGSDNSIDIQKVINKVLGL